MDCNTCKSLRGEISLTSGPVIWSGQYWQVEHVYPVSIKGWLVVVLKQHIEALHSLTPPEWGELRAIQGEFFSLLHTKLGTQKEYSFCFAEKEGFQHIHFHIVGISEDLPIEKRGAEIFSLLKETPLPEKEIADFSEELRKSLSNGK